MEGLFERPDNSLVHHLQRRRNNAGCDNFADRVGGVVDRVEHAEHRAIALWVAGQTNPSFRNDGQRAFAADQRADQIEPGSLLGRSAELDNRPVGHHRLDAQDVIDGHSVFKRVRPARIRGHVSAERAGALARRIGGVMITAAGQGLGGTDEPARL